jgi:glutamyl-tRNA synthetase
MLDPADFANRLAEFMVARGALGAAPSSENLAVVAAAAPLVHERIQTLGEAVGMLEFLFVAETDFTVDENVAAQLGGDGQAALVAAREALTALPEWTLADIESSLRAVLIEGLGLKPRHAFGPLRVAISGRSVSPPLFESMELLGRERTLGRLSGAIG